MDNVMQGYDLDAAVRQIGKAIGKAAKAAPDAAAAFTYDEIVQGWTALPLASEAGHEHPVVVVSRSHQTPETHEHIARLREMHPDLEDDGEIGKIAQMLDAYMEARQDFMEENGLADD